MIIKLLLTQMVFFLVGYFVLNLTKNNSKLEDRIATVMTVQSILLVITGVITLMIKIWA